MQIQAKTTQNLDKFALRKIQASFLPKKDMMSDSLEAWMLSYLEFAIRGVSSEAVTQKIALHLRRFQAFFFDAYGHDRLSTCLRRDVQAWQQALQAQELAHSTINNHLASLSAFTTWVQVHAPDLFPAGVPAKGVGELGLSPLEPRSLSPEQVRSLKKVVNWALRQIGKRNATLRASALEWAEQIRAMDSKTARWIANDAIKELLAHEVKETTQEKRPYS